MRIDFELLRQHGYTVDFYDDDGRSMDRVKGGVESLPAAVTVRGDDPHCVEAVMDALREAFPRVPRDTVAGIAFEAVAKGIGQDVVEICSKS